MLSISPQRALTDPSHEAQDTLQNGRHLNSTLMGGQLPNIQGKPHSLHLFWSLLILVDKFLGPVPYLNVQRIFPLSTQEVVTAM